MPSDPLYGTTDPELLQVGDGSDHDAIYANEGNDTLMGLSGNDVLWGEGGNDRIYGGTDNDQIEGGDGNDRIWGEAGDDRIEAGWGSDTVYGGGGNDAISSGYGDDKLYGGGGNDSIWMAGVIPHGPKLADGGAGNDIATFFGWAEGQFEGGAGQDTISLYWYAPGDDYWARVAVDMTAADPVARSFSAYGNGANDLEVTFSNVEVLQIQTAFGADTVTGGDGDDWISVHLGENIVDAGAGDDRVSYLTAQANTLEGGSGTDTLTVGHANYLVLDFDASGAVASDGLGSVLTGFERFEVYGGSYGDTVTLGALADGFYGGHGDDTAWGGAGDDRLDGWRDADELHGEDGNDRLYGGRHADTLYGGADNDKLYGGAENDALYGGDGRDTLFGGYGGDLMFGDAGADTFRFEAVVVTAMGDDRIGDFVTGADRLVFLQSMLGGTPDLGRQSASDLSFGGVSGTDGQFRYDVVGGDGWLSWDPDGEGATGASLLVVLTGAAALVGSDIYIA